MLKYLKQNGFASITEIIITSVIFVLAAAGILSTVAMLRPQGGASSEKIEAAYIGKAILDDLRKDVDASTFTTGGLTIGDHGPTVVGQYTISYTVTEPQPNVRHLAMTITWPD